MIATTQFYLYGRRHCTANGWRRASANYNLGMLDTVDLSSKVFIVTGANSGIGRCLSDYLASRGASLYMVCRNEARAEVAMCEIRAASGNDKVHTLIGDCSLAADVRRVMREFGSRERRLDGLVCNAGAMTPTKTVTSEGYEVTLATHLLHGSYLLATLAMPHLRRSEAGPRVLFVSSGGMYNTPWPGWATANDAPASEYKQELAYAYAKRGQVLLAEAWASDPFFTGIAIASCHPGWTDTPGVDGWIGRGKAALAPLRTPWQGTEGMAWLCVCPQAEIQSGEFYLDRAPRTKHLSGPFFTEGTYTQNSPEEVSELMQAMRDATRMPG